MSAAVIGNIVGRVVISYFIVWTVMWFAVARRDWRSATFYTRRWYGVTSVLLIVSIGLLMTTARSPIA